MMAGDDDDKTVFGQKLPPPPPSKGQAGRKATPPPSTPSSPPEPAPDQDKTVFGAPLPPADDGRAGRPTSTPQQPPAGYEDTWIGGTLNPPPQPVPPRHQQPPGIQSRPQYPTRAATPQDGSADMFPDIPTPQQQAPRMQTPRIALSTALKGTGLGKGGSSNPLVAAAANLLILLGRLRTGLVEMDSGPLIDHVTREIDLFERNALQSGVSSQDATDAKYALSATADDIVQNLPGADRSVWIQYSMVARFFGERSSGVGFFQKVDEAMKTPGQRFHLLELILTCLSLGFEGQYRTAPNGSVDLARVRAAIYETLRRVQPRPDDDIAVKWEAVPLGGGRRYGGTPIWLVAAIAAMMVVALFATLSTLLTRQGAQVRDGILALHAGRPAITIERTKPIEKPYVAPESTQLQRIRASLAEEIEAGAVEVDRNNEFIYVRVGDVLRFGSGSADLKSEFSVLAASIGRTLGAEEGPIRVVGHTDSVRPSGRGRYKTNETLSVARAQTVADILKQYISDPARIGVEGKGAVEPIADNATRDGRATNRRVEIMIAREETL